MPQSPDWRQKHSSDHTRQHIQTRNLCAPGSNILLGTQEAPARSRMRSEFDAELSKAKTKRCVNTFQNVGQHTGKIATEHVWANINQLAEEKTDVVKMAWLAYQRVRSLHLLKLWAAGECVKCKCSDPRHSIKSNSNSYNNFAQTPPQLPRPPGD